MRLTASRVSITSSGGAVLDAIQQEDPTLDLNFEETKTLTDDVSGTNLVTFNRASSGTYVDSDGLIKTSPVNKLLYSNEFTNAAWLSNSVTSTSTNITAPDGTATARTFTFTQGQGYIYQNTSSVIGQSYVNSIWIKGNANATLGLRRPGMGNTMIGIGSVAINVTTEWQKFTAVTTSADSTDGRLLLDFRYVSGASVPSGFEVSLWHAQTEEGTTATTYIPTGATIGGAPRFDHDPVTGESLGLLIEESRTNLAKYSEPDDRSTSSVSGEWNSSDLDPNTEITKVEGPDGVSNSASEMQLKTGSGIDTFLYRVPVTSGASYTFSAWVKLGTATNFTLHVNDTLAWDSVPDGRYSFDVNDGLNTNTFVKVSHTFTAPSNGIVNVHIGRHGGTAPVQQTQGTVTVWGCQLELGAFSSSTIITSGSTVTRAADLASITGTNFSSWYNQSEGTVFVDRTFNINNGQTYYFTDSVLVLNRVRLEGINHYGNNSSDGSSFTTAAASNKTALGLQTDNVSVNGGTPDTSFTMPSSLDRLFIGRHPTVSSYLNGHIARLAYFPTRKTDQQLIDLTT